MKTLAKAVDPSEAHESSSTCMYGIHCHTSIELMEASIHFQTRNKMCVFPAEIQVVSSIGAGILFGIDWAPQHLQECLAHSPYQ